MAAIDRDKLLTDTLSWLPSDNQLSDSMILTLAETVISNLTADDDVYYAEAVCKTLRSCGYANKTLAMTLSNNKKREKSYMREVEYYDSNSISTWDDYIDSLYDFCPNVLGYTGLTSKAAVGIRINVPDPIRVPCGSVDYGRVGFDGCTDDV